MTARLSFVLAFVIFVLFVTKLVSYIVPDTPRHLELTIKREKYLISKADKEHKKHCSGTHHHEEEVPDLFEQFDDGGEGGGDEEDGEEKEWNEDKLII